MHLIELFLEDCCREITSDINWRCKKKLYSFFLEQNSFFLPILAATQEQLAMSQISIERMVMAKIYTAALYPNGQIDVQRDQYKKKNFNIFQKLIIFFFLL